MTDSPCAPSQIGTRVYCDDDQHAFARLSGDFNPMHTDAVAARRLITGRRVVHGIHLLLTAIEYWATNDRHGDAKSHLGFISCAFDNPVNVGDQVVFTQLPNTEHQPILEISVSGLVCTRIVLEFCADHLELEKPTSSVVGGDAVSGCDNLEVPLAEAPNFHLNKRYALQISERTYPSYFPRACQALGTLGVAATAALSYIVGMVCPGLHSVFSSVTIDLRAEPAPSDILFFSILKYDARFRIFNIGFDGALGGTLKAFLRPPPQAQPTVRDLSSSLEPEEFKGTRSLVIGGSRGLGEVTAKILAAGGGAVTVTYAAGHDDASAIRNEINSFGHGTCEIKLLDLTAAPCSSLAIDWKSLDFVFYFATPRIFRKKSNLFDLGVFQEFLDFYIKELYELCVFLETTLDHKRIRIYVPSSVYIAERPRGMAEYAMAKSASEILVQEINRTFKKVYVLDTRLPRLSTDQTTTVLQSTAASNVDALVPIIRALHTAGSVPQPRA